MKHAWIPLFVAACLASGARAKDTTLVSPGCEHQSAKECLNLAFEAMGGRERLREVRSPHPA